jgi:hypothetical protein
MHAPLTRTHTRPHLLETYCPVLTRLSAPITTPPLNRTATMVVPVCGSSEPEPVAPLLLAACVLLLVATDCRANALRSMLAHTRARWRGARGRVLLVLLCGAFAGGGGPDQMMLSESQAQQQLPITTLAWAQRGGARARSPDQTACGGVCGFRTTEKNVWDVNNL